MMGLVLANSAQFVARAVVLWGAMRRAGLRGAGAARTLRGSLLATIAMAIATLLALVATDGLPLWWALALIGRDVALDLDASWEPALRAQGTHRSACQAGSAASTARTSASPSIFPTLSSIPSAAFASAVSATSLDARGTIIAPAESTADRPRKRRAPSARATLRESQCVRVVSRRTLR